MAMEEHDNSRSYQVIPLEIVRSGNDQNLKTVIHYNKTLFNGNNNTFCDDTLHWMILLLYYFLSLYGSWEK